ncbi:MAG TPA: hypothetical protein VGH91_12490 [Gammaproteobacteria bacterium]|jgi:hypothetical protein
MTRYPLLSMFLSVCIIAAVAAGTWIRFHPRTINADIRYLDSHVMVVEPFPGVALPPGVQAGDRVDLREQSLATRLVWSANPGPVGETISVVGHRDGQTITAQVPFVDQRPQFGVSGLMAYALPWCGGAALMAAIALLLIWRGRDRAAYAMALWAACFVMSAQINLIPLTGWPDFIVYLFSICCFLAARIGFFFLAEIRVGAALSPGQRLGYRLSFWILWVLGTVYALGGPLLVVTSGWGGLLNTDYGLILTASYLVPVLMLYTGYRRAAAAERQRLRWMWVSGVSWVLGIMVQNTPVFGALGSNLVSNALLILAMGGFLYAVLRLRVVDVSVVMDRALVYAGMTTLVVGIVAALNSLALRATLVPGASFALQVIVPLSLGILFGRLRSYMDKLVERVFFRSKYLAERALRTFARRVGHIEEVAALLDATASEISRHTGTPALAIYSAESGGYRCVRQTSARAFPERIQSDDAAFVALRADRKAVALGSLSSGLGDDGCVFPMLVLGTLRGAIICKNRPGEHFGSDEKKLLTQVAREVGAAWRILRARDNEALVLALAEGVLPPEAAREKARALALGWNRA